MINRLRRKLDAILRNGIVRSVGVLVGGTAFAQALTVLALPVLTRLYTPEDFSLLAVFTAILAILAPVACLRLEIAIPMPESDEDAANLLAVALLSAAAIGLVTALLLLPFGGWFTEVIRRPEFQPYLWLVPLAVWLAASYSGLQYWLTRKKRFPVIARTRIARALGGITVQTGMGVLSAGPLGLLLGHAVSSSAGIASLVRSIRQHDLPAIASIRWRNMHAVFRRYDRFPRYSTLESLANNGGIQVPVLLIAALAADPEAGFLLLAMRVMAVPIGLVGSAVAQVYLANAAEEKRAGRLGDFSAQMIGGLMRTGVGPLLFVGILAPFVFPFVFGSGWSRAGQLVSWMTPWFIAQFVTSPVSMALHVLDQQITALVLQIFGLILRVGAVIIAASAFPAALAEWYAISGLVFYLIYLLVVKHGAEIPTSALLRNIRTATPSLVAWITSALLVTLAVS